jgi:hypothetical protein
MHTWSVINILREVMRYESCAQLQRRTDVRSHRSGVGGKTVFIYKRFWRCDAITPLLNRPSYDILINRKSTGSLLQTGRPSASAVPLVNARRNW